MENIPRGNEEGCPFCNPQDSHGRNGVLRHNTHAFVTLSNPRKVPGHLLVIPKRHIEKPWELQEEEIKDIFELIALVQQKITQSLTAGCQVRQNYMPFLAEGTIKVNHVHYHVLPRSLNDDLYLRADISENELFEMLSDDERARIEAMLS